MWVLLWKEQLGDQQSNIAQHRCVTHFNKKSLVRLFPQHHHGHCAGSAFRSKCSDQKLK
jgi:hypothetical protein